MDNFKIYPAEPKDSELLYNLIIQMAEFENEKDEVKTSSELIKNTICSKKYAEAYIGYLNNKPVSYVIYYYTYSSYLGKRSLFIEDLYISPESRGKGIGKKMFEHIKQKAVKEDCGRLDWTCLSWNRNAAEFYEHLGGIFRKDRMYYRIEL